MESNLLKSFLADTKKQLKNNLKEVSTVHVVLGNESCDLDSAVSSVVLAYIKNLCNSDPRELFIPVLNIARQKYHLRTETTYLFRKHQITDDLLTFCDDIDLFDLHRGHKLKLSLVDHNILSERYRDLEECVVSVVDHRLQVRQPDPSVQITIAPVGSCATLIAKEFFDEIYGKPELSYDRTILTFLYGTILVDTVNMNPAAHKVTDVDREMVGKLQEQLPDVNGEELYNNIQTAKTDISELTTLELLEKDMKIVSGIKIKLAMSSICTDLQSFLTRPDLQSDLDIFTQSQHVDGLIVMMIHDKGQIHRDVIVYSFNTQLIDKIVNSLTKTTDPNLELTEVHSELKHSKCYHQGLIKASRKQVLPIIQCSLTEFESETNQSSNSSGNQVNLLDNFDLLTSTPLQTSENRSETAVSSALMDDLNFNQSSQNQSQTSTNQSLMDEFDIFSGTNASNLQSKPSEQLNFDLLSDSNDNKPIENSAMNVDLLVGLDPFSSNDSHGKSLIPEININSAVDLEDFNEADIMFDSANLVSGTSQGSSAHTSEPGSAFASYPVTPPNSFIDSSGHVHMKDFTLPSLNSAEMMEKFREKKGRLRSTESTSADVTDNEGGSVPYTPQNSYMESNLEQFAVDRQLPSFNSLEMIEKIKQKRSTLESLDQSDNDNFTRLRSESGEATPFTPHNSYRDISVLDRHKMTVLDHTKLHQTLSRIESLPENQQEVDDSLEIKEITDTGLMIFDASNVENPTDVHNNAVAVGIAKEMVNSSISDAGLLEWYNEESGSGDGKSRDSNSPNGTSKDSNTPNEPSDRDVKKETSSGQKSDGTNRGKRNDCVKQEELLLNASIDEFARHFTEKLIEDAVNAFPHDVKVKEAAQSHDHDKGDNLKEGRLLGTSSSGPLLTPSPEELPVETDYLSTVDPMRGNLDLVQGSDDKEIVESSSFRKISGEEPQTVRQEILKARAKANGTKRPKQDAIQEFAIKLVNHVISGAIATVTNGNNVNIVSDDSSDITENSGTTLSRETSFDTVSSIKDGQTVLWSNQTSLDTPRSSIDKNSGGPSFESDDVIINQEMSENSSSSNSNPLVLHDSSREKIIKESNSDSVGQNDSKTVIGETHTNHIEEKDNLELSLNSLNHSHDKKGHEKSSRNVTFNKFESIDYISSENETDNLAELKCENADLLEQQPVPYNLRKLDSLDYISSEGEGDNIGKLKAEQSDLRKAAKSSYQKADTLDYISSEGEEPNTEFVASLQDMYSSESSDVTSTTTEGSYQVLSPDQQLNDIKRETTLGASVNTDLFGCDGSNKGANDLSKEEKEPGIEHVESKNEVFTKNVPSKTEVTKGQGHEVYMTSAGRISIASEGDGDGSKRGSCTDDFILEAHEEVGKLISSADETVAQADWTMKSADTLLACINVNPTEDPCTIPNHLNVFTHANCDLKCMDKIDKEGLREKDSKTESKDKTEEGQETSLPDSGNPELSGELEKAKSKDVNKDEPPANLRNKSNEEGNKPVVKKKKNMDLTEEWHEDPIPGMGNEDADSLSSGSRSRHSSGSSDSSDSTRPANRPKTLKTQKKKRISAHFNILNEDYASPDEVEPNDTAGDLEWENDTPVSIPCDPLPEYSAEDEFQDAKHWRGIEINGKQEKIDLRVIEPYKKVLSHGGYYGDGLNAIIVFSGCYLPDRNRKDYNYVMDNLFMYVISTLELLVAEDYMIVYFHGATPRRQMPSFGWLKKCYQMIDRRLKKNLKGLLLIHPTLWLRTIVLMTKPFISSKFSSKIRFVRSLQDLSKIVPMEYIYVPEQVNKYDSLLHSRASPSTSASHTPP